MILAALSASVLAIPATTGTQAQTRQQQNVERRFSLHSPVATIARTELRDQPAADGTVLTILPINARATVIGGPFNDGWYWLEYNSRRGYAPGRYLVQVDENYTPVPEVTDTPTPEPPQSTPTAPVAQPTPTSGANPTAVPTEDAGIPVTGDYSGLWIGEMTTGGNVRTGPGLNYKVLKSWWAGRRVLLYEAVTTQGGDVWYRVSDPPETPMYVHSSLVRKVMAVKYEPARYRGKWININISQQVVTAYENGTPVKVTLTSTGTRKNPTELGVWKIYYRLPKQDMDGGSLAAGDYYNLKDVPWVQYFHMSGEALHGTYWHDNFGRPMSHGCVNLSTPMAQWFYNWARIGTIVYVHN
jgi:uncharacterized protein YgiM (DUF1202 family)